MSKYKTFINLGPGDSIQDELEFYGWGKRRLAVRLGMSVPEAERLLRNRLPITPELATKLSRMFQQSPQFWLNLQCRYSDRLAKADAK